MQRIMFEDMYNYFYRNNIKLVFFLDKLIETCHNIVKTVDDGKSFCMVFCELSKAFDRVWHKDILVKFKLTE